METNCRYTVTTIGKTIRKKLWRKKFEENTPICWTIFKFLNCVDTVTTIELVSLCNTGQNFLPKMY